MNGKLSEQPLTELIREISLAELSGTLRLEHERARAVVYFEEGRLVFAASNLRELRIKEYLKKRALASENELAILDNNRSDVALVAALCAKGSIDGNDVVPLFARQVADILRVAVLWTEGDWVFDERARLGGSVHVKVDTTSLLMEAARTMELKLVSSRFPNPDELISPVAGIPDFGGLLPAEGFVLSRVDAPMRLSELIAVSGLPELDASRAIYGLVLGCFLEREHRQTALQAATKRKPGPRRGPFVEQPAASDQSSTPATSEEDLRQFFLRLRNSTNHYEVLDVSATAEVKEIKRAYYTLARLYHPDRFHVMASTALYAEIESAFARITQAYETLTDSALRTSYDARLAAQEKSRQFATSAPPSGKSGQVSGPENLRAANAFPETRLKGAEKSFEEGFAALQQGQINVALTLLAAAARELPREPRYRAYYGQALAAQERTRRLAEVEMQAAVKLDPSNASYRAMLGELYFELTFYRRARAEAERALALDRDNSVARILLRKLKANRKTE